MQKHDVIHNTGNAQHIAVAPKKERASVSSYMHKDFCQDFAKFAMWFLRYANRQTNEQNHHKTLHRVITTMTSESYVADFTAGAAF